MKDELLLRLESFEIDEPGIEFPFSARLARENGWSHRYALRVVDEYKRFVWLAMKAGHPVTPSEEVDEAWHLHLCYTRSYWERMCGAVLGKPLHHGPTEGGKKEEAKFADWYSRTLESYRACFGEEPPADIWPPAEIRFRPVTVLKVDAAKHWIIPKRMTKRVAIGVPVVAVLPVLAGCSNLAAVTEFEGTLFVLVVAVIVIGLILYAAKKWGKGGNGCSSGCSSTSCGGGGSSGCGSNSHGDSGSSGCSSSGCFSGCGGGGGD